MDGTPFISAILIKRSNKAYSGPLTSGGRDMRVWRVIWGPSRGGSWRVDSGVNSELILGQFWTLSQKPHQMSQKSLHLAVGRALSLEYVKYGYWEGAVGSTRYSPSRHPPSYPPRVHPRWSPRTELSCTGLSASHNMVVGLISVHQLSLCLHFSGFQGITEVYNLCTAGNPNNHFHIPGFE